ncbi:glycosyltransferase family 4 protein [Candidatus Magnetaquicoccus inordinatus]|uniref:glycosyltransferase family 4 protein n=1 Tax=Candidatus Magnetaquicoccus inordinatus TaxID=2496818 RepID=UPI00102BE7A1|nr:glycosyltransferase family 4 protein [Candidatus Magnetaquicoccus inordinatus]
MANHPEDPPIRTGLRVGFLVYDLKPFIADYVARIALRLPGPVRAYPILDGQVAENLPFTWKPSRLRGLFFSVRVPGFTPEGFLSSVNWQAAWSCAWENDLVLLSGLQGGTALLTTLFATLLHRPVISINQTLPPEWEQRRRWWIRWLKKWLLQRCRLHIVQSPITRLTLRRIYGIADHLMVDAPFEAGATAFDLHLQRLSASRKSLRQALSWPDDLPVFLFVGTLLRFKGVITLIEATAHLHRQGHRLQVICIGERAGQPEEPSRENYQQMAAHAGVADIISFPGPCSLSDLAARYQAADACLLPTQKDCFPKVLVEAALARLALVTTSACGASAALVRDGESGFVIPPNDHLALATAMHRLLDPHLCRQMGENARAICLEFCDHEKETQGFLRAIHRASQS